MGEKEKPHWIIFDFVIGSSIFCSECFTETKKMTNFCRKCGADMRKKGNNEKDSKA